MKTINVTVTMQLTEIQVANMLAAQVAAYGVPDDAPTADGWPRMRTIRETLHDYIHDQAILWDETSLGESDMKWVDAARERLFGRR